MTTINTIQDLQRILEEKPEWRAALRSILLTQELLELPQRFREMTESVNTLAATIRDLRKHADTRYDELKEHTDNRHNELKEQFIELKEHTDNRYNELKEHTDTRIDELREHTDGSIDRLRRDMTSRLDRQHRIMRDLQTDYSNFRGNYSESAARKDGIQIAGLFARRRGIRERVSAIPLSRDELLNLLSANLDAIEELNLEESAWSSFQEPDLIIRVTPLGVGNSALFYMAVEASYTVDDRDVQRATDNARILRQATGLDAYAVVSGARLSSRLTKPVLKNFEDYFTEADLDVALWRQIFEEDMEPQP